MAHVLPALLDLDATYAAAVSSARAQAVVAGDTYELDIVVLDEDQNPFNAGPQATPYWTIAAQLRNATVFDGGVIEAAFTGAWVNAPVGQLRISLTPAATSAIASRGGTWDVQITNKSSGGDPAYAAGYVQTVAQGRWILIQDSTR